MKDILKLGGILLLVTVVASAVLAFVNKETKPRILEQARLEKEQALTEALPMADKNAIVLHPDGYYVGYEDTTQQEVVGYALSAFGKGYSSEIETLVGIDTSGVVCGIKILSQTETPGLGTKIVEKRYGETSPWFQQQFINKSYNQLYLKKDKPTGTIDAITGATISSVAVTSSVQQAVESVVTQLKLGKDNH